MIGGGITVSPFGRLHRFFFVKKFTDYIIEKEKL